MTDKERKRVDSVHSKTERMKNLTKEIIIPARLDVRDVEQEFYLAIIRARAIETWNDIDYNHAANLARCQADIERIQLELRHEDDILKNERGTSVLNPKHTLLETLTRRSIALSKALQVNAMSTVGLTKDVKKKNTAQRDDLRKVDKTKDEDLLARPTH